MTQLNLNLSAQPQTDVRDGMRDASPILFALAPFAALFGAVATERGFSFSEVILTSMSIYAVASQYVMVDLMGQGMPVWSIVLAVFAVNFRHVLYSAAIGRHLTDFTFLQRGLAYFMLVDPQYAASETRANTIGLRPAYYFAYAFTIYSVWVVCNGLGVVFGGLIENPEKFGIDFLLPIYFTAMIMEFHTRPSFLPVLAVSALTSLVVHATIGSPWHITLGGLAGLLVAAVLAPTNEVSEND